ncbi:MAG: DUF1599 domain-containing protein [Lachnospiraceae bacterium]|nr:DUF1599 domain-containing protein [Lachnospiraceae bacterium]
MNQIEEHKKLVEFLHDVYVRKNHDYGDSFSRSFGKYGITAALVRMEDKWNRLENLAGGEKQRVPDESLRDTCLDLANYCLMTVMELDRKNEAGIYEDRTNEADAKLSAYMSEREKNQTDDGTIAADKDCVEAGAALNDIAETGTVKITIPDKLEREKKPIDEGKVMALHKAKWSQAKIADEMGCSQARVSQIIRAQKG